MSKPYESTKTWQAAFDSTSSEEVAQRLSSQYAIAWERACSISSRISDDAAGLTLHNEMHFIQLWKCIDLIATKECELSPVEAFILGVAVLIHDVAHTVLAYEGGRSQIESTPEWKDSWTLWHRFHTPPGKSEDSIKPTDENIRQILFDTLRTLHAQQASKFLSIPFKHPAFHTDIYLIDDFTLRSHLGQLIGDVAASHHWDIGALRGLGAQKNMPHPFDKFGPVRPLLLAAILRAADAIQIDAGRALDFDFALLQPQGLSLWHWTAQNRIAVAPDSADPSSLLITSLAPFGVEDAPAWWVAYELAKVADTELRGCDQFLRDHGQPHLALRRVSGISHPHQFAEHVRTAGWEPTSAEVRVTEPRRIIEMFGGARFYGSQPSIPLRELLQNAVDAVRSRRALESEYRGRITVTLVAGLNREGEEGHWLHVSDDGIGMSQAILTGPFLAFGESGWLSTQLRRERPGLISKHVKRIGRFGIGFFSIFMIADEIKVSSRPFDRSINEARLLEFRKGLGLKPIVVVSHENLSMMTVTTVAAFLSSTQTDILLHKNDKGVGYEDGSSYEIRKSSYMLSELIGELYPAIDIELITNSTKEGTKRVTDGLWTQEEPLTWLRRINGGSGTKIPDVILSNLDMLEVIEVGGEVIGRAALSPHHTHLGIKSMAGFGRVRRDPVQTHTSEFFGVLIMKPEDPRREFGPYMDDSVIAEWANRQVNRWSSVDLGDLERHLLAAKCTALGGDPFQIANALVGDEWVSAKEMAYRIKAGERFLAPVIPERFKGGYVVAEGVVGESGLFVMEEDIERRPNIFTSRESRDLREYWHVPDSDDISPHSFISIVCRYAQEIGCMISVRGGLLEFGKYKGPPRRYIRLSDDGEFVSPGIELLC